MKNLSCQQGNRLIWGLSIASVVVYINLYIFQGMLPLAADTFSVSMDSASYLLPITTFSIAFSVLLFAVLSDRCGRRQPIIIALICLAISNFILVCIMDFEMLLALRLLQGIILAAVPATAMAYFKDQLSSDLLLKSAATYIAANSVGGIIGRLLGGMLSYYLNWHQAMLCLSLFTLIAVALVIWFLPEETRNKKRVKTPLLQQVINDFCGFKSHMLDRQLNLVFAIGALSFMVMVNQFSFIQLHLLQPCFDFNTFQVTLIFVCYLSGTLLSYTSAKSIARFGTTKLFIFGVLAMMFGSLVTLHNTVSTIFLGFFISAGGFFLLHTCANSYIARHVTSHKAKATSLYLCCYYLGAALGGPLLMLFWQAANWQGVVMGSCLLLSLLLITVLLFRKRQAFLVQY